MRRPGLAAFAAAGALIGAGGAARAAEHQYYVSSANDKLASVIDLAGKTRTGQVVSFDLILLRRQPVNVNGISAYWADGVEEIDCAGHRRRVMLLAGLTLDRSRKANESGARFEAWEPSAPGTNGRATEDFVCNSGSEPALTSVADLAAFQRDFFQRGAQVAAGPPASRFAPAAAPKAAATGPGTKPPAVATARYYLLGDDGPGGALFLKPADSIVSEGIVNVAMYNLLDQPAQVESGLVVSWGEGDAIFDCKQHRWRWAVSRFYRLDMTQSQEVKGAKFSDWAGIEPGSAMARGEALMCLNRLVPGVVAVNDLGAYATQRGAGRTRPAQAAPAQPKPASPSPPPKKTDYHWAGMSEDGASLIDKASIKRQGDIVTYVQLNVLPEPDKFQGKVIDWFEATVQTDCKTHRERTRIDAYLNDKRTVRTIEPASKYSPWQTNGPTSFGRAVEEYVCLGKDAKDFDAIADVDEFRTEYLAALKGGVFKQ
jgi:hypothetical protein